MLGLYLHTLHFGHKSCNMLSILNKLTYYIAKGIAKYCNKYCVFGQKVKTQQQQHKQIIKHKNPCWSRKLNPGPLTPKADALPLHHRVN